MEPTRLRLETIVWAVRTALNLQQFEEDRANRCRAGECTSRKSAPCDWYAFGLHRCSDVRRETHVSRQRPVAPKFEPTRTAATTLKISVAPVAASGPIRKIVRRLPPGSR